MIRPGILRQYHEATYGGRPALASAYLGATFDEYVALCRTRYPRMSAWRAALDSPREDLRAEAARLPPVGPKTAVLSICTHLERLPALDLATASFAEDTARLILDRIKSVSGWTRIHSAAGLSGLVVNLCGAEHEDPIVPAIGLHRVIINECNTACLRTLLRGTRATELEVTHTASPVLDLELVAHHRSLASLRVSAPLVKGLASIADLPLRTLSIGRVSSEAALTELLRRRASTLENLTLGGAAPRGPDVLPPLPKLSRLSLPGYAETREAWIDFAVAHPGVGCFFSTLDAPSPARAAFAVEEVHRGVDILRVTKGKKITFEVATDLPEMCGSAVPGDNGDLEDRLRLAARAAKKKVTWSSEADALVARASDVATLRWVIDTALDSGHLEGRRKSSKP